MRFLTIQPLTSELLPFALELDRLSLGGLWSADGYLREIESPNSDLLILQEIEREGRDTRQKTEDRGQKTEDRGVKGDEGDLETISSPPSLPSPSPPSPITYSLPTTNLQSPIPNLQSPLPSPSPPSPITHYPLPTTNLQSPTPALPLALGCSWAILEEAHITLVAVHPAYQRQGLGQVMLYALFAAACKRQLERATLEVRISNQAAISLYKKFGFKEAGRRKRYYQDTGEDALVMWVGGLHQPDFLQTLAQWRREVCDRLYQSGWQLPQLESSIHNKLLDSSTIGD